MDTVTGECILRPKIGPNNCVASLTTGHVATSTIVQDPRTDRKFFWANSHVINFVLRSAFFFNGPLASE